VPALIVIALVFIIINYALTTLAGYIERRLRARGRSSLGQEAGMLDAEPVDAGTPTA
jgi:glutamate transport system permease protein